MNTKEAGMTPEQMAERIRELEDHLILAANELDVFSDDVLLCAAIRSVATTALTPKT